MAAEVVTIGVNGKELWNSLTLNEGLRYSPKFQLALRTCECEADILQERYKEAVDMFHITVKVRLPILLASLY